MKKTLAIVLAAWALVCCSNDPDIATFAPPQLLEAEAIQGDAYSQVVLRCRLDRSAGVSECGFLFGQNELEEHPAQEVTDSCFSVTIDGLSYSTAYRWSAYIGSGRDRLRSKDYTWDTPDEVPPIPEIVSVTAGLGSNAGKATLYCLIPQYPAVVRKDVFHCGICYSLVVAEPTIEGGRVEAQPSSAGEFILNMENLLPTKTYYFRPYTQIGKLVTYGAADSLKIPSGTDVAISVGYSDVTFRSATLRGAVNLDGGGWTSRICGFELDGISYNASEVGDDGYFSLTVNDLSADTEYAFRATVRVDGAMYYGESITFRTSAMPGMDVGYVDLGLSVLWATCDLGASKPEERGTNFAWGEVTTRTDGYWWPTYKYCNGSSESIFKYTMDGYCPNPDNKTRLDPEDDAAHVILQGKWRMPTVEECQELIDSCTCTLFQMNGINGTLVTSRVKGYEDKCIFLRLFYSSAYYIWTADLSPVKTELACILSSTVGDPFEEGRLGVGDGFLAYTDRAERCCGRAIRPVMKKE
ncbi:MAG: hypothetical protein J5771_06095 [Bacteroidales bacterium]|nr:hypothetical protein [Bacteroidales bacterium]